LIKQLSGIFAGGCLFIAVYGVPPFTGGPNAEYLSEAARSEFKTEVRRQANGLYEVSALTPMPGVTPEMVRWWFADYMQTTQHYKRWHPTAHVWMDWENKRAGDYVGASHLVHEYIGEDLAKLRIQFVPAEDILGEVQFRADDVAVCARAGLLEKPFYGGAMCHVIRSTDGGAEMLSRFWLGQVAKRDGNEPIKSFEGLVGNTYLARMIGVAHADAADLMTHATEEMQTLATFLPELYAAENLRAK